MKLDTRIKVTKKVKKEELKYTVQTFETTDGMVFNRSEDASNWQKTIDLKDLRSSYSYEEIADDTQFFSYDPYEQVKRMYWIKISDPIPESFIDDMKRIFLCSSKKIYQNKFWKDIYCKLTPGWLAIEYWYEDSDTDISRDGYNVYTLEEAKNIMMKRIELAEIKIREYEERKKSK